MRFRLHYLLALLVVPTLSTPLSVRPWAEYHGDRPMIEKRVEVPPPKWDFWPILIGSSLGGSGVFFIKKMYEVIRIWYYYQQLDQYQQSHGIFPGNPQWRNITAERPLVIKAIGRNINALPASGAALAAELPRIYPNMTDPTLPLAATVTVIIEHTVTVFAPVATLSTSHSEPTTTTVSGSAASPLTTIGAPGSKSSNTNNPHQESGTQIIPVNPVHAASGPAPGSAA